MLGGYEIGRLVSPNVGSGTSFQGSNVTTESGEKFSGEGSLDPFSGHGPHMGYAAAYSDKLGSSDFPGIIVREEEWARTIQDAARKPASPWSNDLPYKVFVLPNGVGGSWAENNVESFLMVPWAYCIYQQDMDFEGSCKQDVQEFYQKFYRCSDFTQLLDGYGVTYDIAGS